MKFSVILLIASGLIVVACGNTQDSNQAGNNPAPQTPLQPKDLSAMSLPDVLSAKYDSVILNCNLWARMKGPLVIEDTPNDTVSVDLIKDSKFPKTIDLAAKSDIHSLSIQITLTEMKLQNGGSTDRFGAHYSFKNSPAIYGQFTGKTGTSYPDGYTGGPFEGNSIILNENIISQIVAGSSGPTSERNPTVDYVDCSIATKVKSAYKGEWKQDGTGNEPSCLLGQPVNPIDCMIRQKP